MTLLPYCKTCRHRLPSIIRQCVTCNKHRGHKSWDYRCRDDWEEGSLTKQEMDEFVEWLKEEAAKDEEAKRRRND